MSLEKLLEVNWDIYSHRLDIPRLIRDMAGNDPKARFDASMDMSQVVISASSFLGSSSTDGLYAALENDLLSVIASFLIELLADPKYPILDDTEYPHVEGKRHLLECLFEMWSIDKIEFMKLTGHYQENAQKLLQTILNASDVYMEQLKIETDPDSQIILFYFLADAAALKIGSVPPTDIALYLLEFIERSEDHLVRLSSVEAIEDMLGKNQDINEQFGERYLSVVRGWEKPPN